MAVEDDDFCEEVQDAGGAQTDAQLGEEKALFIRTGAETEWYGIRRKGSELVQHQKCCFGINHSKYFSDHHLYMVDVFSEDEQPPESVLCTIGEPGTNAILQDSAPRSNMQRRRPQFYDRQQQLELVLEAQRSLEAEGQGAPSGTGDEKEECEARSRNSDIWEDSNCMELLQTGTFLISIDPMESKRARKRILNYRWQEQSLYFRDRLVPEPKDRLELVVQMHSNLGHSGEERTLTEICRRYFWHDRTESVRAVVKGCLQCQLIRGTGSIRSSDEELKSIPVCDLFYRVALDTAGPLPETKSGNRYVLVAIDHYSKWCEAKAVADHGAKTAARFLEDEVIYRYGVPRFVLTDNGGEWAAEFDTMCSDYNIHHQQTAPHWPQCNGMAERLIQTIKHGVTILSSTPDNTNCWDEQLAKVMFGYRCGV
jgi:transposase InsO family protein